LNIKYFYDNVKFRLRQARKIRALIGRLITDKDRKPGDVNFIFTTGSSLLEINRKFLNHNYFTDVITFNYNVKDVINGEIYISIDDVKENSKYYKVSKSKEILRVMIHGVLHLCGYDDSAEDQIRIMRQEEERWLRYYEDM
jgi:rRNA maturation RNase YbeY